MSKVIVVQDGNLVLTAAGTDVIGDNANVASFQDEFITTDNDNITFADSGNGGFYDTITSDDTGVFFGTAGFRPGMVITVTGSASNDGTYTIGEAGVTDTVITILGGFTDEGPVSTVAGGGAVLLQGIDKAEELTTGSFLNIHSTDALEEFSLNVSNEGWMEIREQNKAGAGLYVYGNGHIGVFDYTEGTADTTQVPVDATDTAYATVGGWNDGQWQLWEVGTFSVGDMDLTIHNYVPDAAITMWVDDITDTNYRRVFEGDYATGANLFWPDTNAIKFSTIATGVRVQGGVYVDEQAAAGADVAGQGQIWVHTDNRLMYTDEASTDAAVAVVSGTPANNYVAHWTDNSTLTGDSTFTWDGTSLAITNLLDTGDAVRFDFASNSEAWISAAVDGATSLYHNGTQKAFTDQAGLGTNDGLYFVGSSSHGFTPGAGSGALWLDSDDDTMYFRDDGGTDYAFAGGTVPAVLASGTPADNQIAVWTASTNTIEGDANFTWDSSATTGIAFEIDAPAGLTAGTMVDISSNLSAKTGNVVRMIQNHASATADVLLMQQNSTSASATLFEMVHTGASSAAYAGRIRTSGIFNGAVLNLHHDHASSTGAVLTITQDGTGNAITITGGDIVTNAHIIVPQVSEEATPTIAFGDGDTGFFEASDGRLDVSVEGTSRWQWNSNDFKGATAGARLQNVTPSSTQPTINPNLGDGGTGMGSAATGTVNIIANEINCMAFDEAAGVVTNTSLGKILTPDGTVSAPTYSFTSDSTTGVYLVTDSVSIAAQGVEASRTTAATVPTDEAVVTEIISIPVASGEGFGFEVHVMGTQDTTGHTVFERIFGAIRNQGGTTALVGSTIVDRTDDAEATTWVISVEADNGGSALTVDVTGEAGHDIDWKVRVELLNV